MEPTLWRRLSLFFEDFAEQKGFCALLFLRQKEHRKEAFQFSEYRRIKLPAFLDPCAFLIYKLGQSGSAGDRENPENILHHFPSFFFCHSVNPIIESAGTPQSIICRFLRSQKGTSQNRPGKPSVLSDSREFAFDRGKSRIVL